MDNIMKAEAVIIVGIIAIGLFAAIHPRPTGLPEGCVFLINDHVVRCDDRPENSNVIADYNTLHFTGQFCVGSGCSYVTPRASQRQ